MTTPRPKLLAIVIPIVLANIGCGLAIWGWSLDKPPHTLDNWLDLVYSGLRSIGLSDAYSDTKGHWQIQVARWLGVLVAFWAVLSLFQRGLRNMRIRLMLLMRRRHLVVVGDTPFAAHFARMAAARAEVVHLCPGESTGLQGELIRLPYTPGRPNALAAANTRAAQRLIIAVADDAEAADLAIQAQAAYPHLSITTRMDDLWLADRLHSVPGAEKLRAFTEAAAAAREIIRRHPPFLTAQDLGHKRIHSVLLGDHDWLEALMVETVLSACTLTFGKPAFTFVCADPDGFRTRLFDRYPDLAEAADIAVFKGEHGVHAPLAPPERQALGQLGPVTVAYCALEPDAASLSAAVALRELTAADATFEAPIFVHAGGHGLARPVPGSRLAARQLVPFGALADIARASGIASSEGELAEKQFHAAYVKFAPGDSEAAKPWGELSEQYRKSNQRAVAHIYAKLFEAGFDLRGWLGRHDSFVGLPDLAKGEALYRNDQERERLAELEHERWMADRRMSGWIAGTERDNDRKVHNNFGPFAGLSEPVKDYDRKFIDLLHRVLKHSKDGMKRRPDRA